MNFNKILINVATACDYIPLVSTATSSATLTFKLVAKIGLISQRTIKNNEFLDYLQRKNELRCFVTLIPYRGNLYLAAYKIVEFISSKFHPVNKPKPPRPQPVLPIFDREAERLQHKKDQYRGNMLREIAFTNSMIARDLNPASLTNIIERIKLDPYDFVSNDHDRNELISDYGREKANELRQAMINDPQIQELITARHVVVRVLIQKIESLPQNERLEAQYTWLVKYAKESIPERPYEQVYVAYKDRLIASLKDSVEKLDKLVAFKRIGELATPERIDLVLAQTLESVKLVIDSSILTKNSYSNLIFRVFASTIGHASAVSEHNLIVRSSEYLELRREVNEKLNTILALAKTYLDQPVDAPSEERVKAEALYDELHSLLGNLGD